MSSSLSLATEGLLGSGDGNIAVNSFTAQIADPVLTAQVRQDPLTAVAPSGAIKVKVTRSELVAGADESVLFATFRGKKLKVKID